MRICVPSLSLYARALGVVRSQPSLAVVIVVGSLMHASGHALLAALGGALAASLSGTGTPKLGGSTEILHALGGGDVLLGLAIGGLLAAVAKLVGGALASWGEARVAGEVGAGVRMDVLERVTAVHLLRNPRQNDHGARLASMTTHVSDVERGVAQGLFAEARGALALGPLAVLLVVLAPRLAGSAVLALVAFGGLVFVARRAMKHGHARATDEAEALASAADEAVKHADLWITYGAQARIKGHVGALGQAMVATASRLRARAAIMSGTSEMLGALALVLVIALASGVDRAALVPFAIAFFMTYKPLREIVEARLARARAEEALAAALDPLPPPPPPTDDVAIAAVRVWDRGELVIQGLVAAHGDHAPVSLRLAPGEVAAIVGPTGIGKTSLLRALLGLEVPRGGTIRYAGESLDGRGAGPAERPFAWVPQAAPILAASLVDNVALAAEDPSRALAELDAVGGGALASSAGETTLVTDRAVSGGERQQIAVARALATDLPILLFDEPRIGCSPRSRRSAVAGR
jgi:ABC-type multidrug transport system fused ATPase/permease subunit